MDVSGRIVDTPDNSLLDMVTPAAGGEEDDVTDTSSSLLAFSSFIDDDEEEEEGNDPLSCTDYVREIFAHLLENEVRCWSFIISCENFAALNDIDDFVRRATIPIRAIWSACRMTSRRPCGRYSSTGWWMCLKSTLGDVASSLMRGLGIPSCRRRCLWR